MVAVSTWITFIALALNYGSRAVTPLVANVICKDSGCDAMVLVASVASAFFAGEMVAQMIAQPLVRRLGGKYLLSFMAIGLSVSMVLMMCALSRLPLTFLFLQFLYGGVCGFGYPAGHAIIAATVPPQSRSLAVCMINAASGIGTMLFTFVIPLVITLFGWQLPFAIVVFVSVAIFPLIRRLQMPQQSRSNSDATNHMNGKELSDWCSEPLVLALFLGQYAMGFGYAFLINFVPTFFMEAFSVKVADLGWLLSAAPFLNATISVFSGFLVQHLSVHRFWPIYQCRMLMQTLGAGVPVASLLAISVTNNAKMAAVLFTMSFAFFGFQSSGQTATFHDVGKLRAGELFCLGNIFAKLAGVVGGQVIGWIGRSVGWKFVLLTVAVHYGASAAILVSLMPRIEQARRVITPDSEKPPSEDVTAIRQMRTQSSTESTSTTEGTDYSVTPSVCSSECEDEN